MDNKISPLEAIIDVGLAKKFLKTFGVPLSLTLSSNRKQEQAKRLKETPKYPMAFAKATSWDITENSYSQQTLLRHGLKGQQNADGMLTYNLKLLPVTTTFAISYLCQDAQDARAFAKAWLFAATRGSLKFTVLYGVANIDIAFDLDRSIQVPERADNETTSVNEMEVLTSLRVMGYMSEDSLQTVQTATAVEINGELIPAQDAATAALQQGGREGVEIFSFKRGWDNTPGPAGSATDS